MGVLGGFARLNNCNTILTHRFRSLRSSQLGKGDRNLDMHHDASEVTLNVCLGRGEFSASGLRFCGEFGRADHRQSKLQLQHSLGRAVLHLGRHRHGADDIASGERVNLIVWARSR